jgi:histidine ammonia-lyase
MGTIAARKSLQILENVQNIIAIEFMCAAQGLDLLSPLRPSEPLQKALDTIRTVVPKLENDRELHKDIHKIKDLMRSDAITSAVEAVTGALFEE